MRALQTFDFESQPVRSFEREGVMWFVVADVCRALGLSNPSVTIQALDADERAKLNLGRRWLAVGKEGVGSTDTPHGASVRGWH